MLFTPEWHYKAWTKWPVLHRLHFQMVFTDRNVYFDSNFTEAWIQLSTRQCWFGQWLEYEERQYQDKWRASSSTHIIVTRAPSQYKDGLAWCGSIIKMRRSSDLLIFIMGISILVRRCPYIETVPRPQRHILFQVGGWTVAVWNRGNDMTGIKCYHVCRSCMLLSWHHAKLRFVSQLLLTWELWLAFINNRNRLQSFLYQLSSFDLWVMPNSSWNG